MKFPFEVKYVPLSNGSLPALGSVAYTVVWASTISDVLELFSSSHQEEKFAVYGVSLCENVLETFKHNATCA